MSEEMKVRDIKTERGIDTNNILQSLLLASTIGFGTLIVNGLWNLTEQVGLLTTSSAVNTGNIARNTGDIKQLRKDFDNHTKGYIQEDK